MPLSDYRAPTYPWVIGTLADDPEKPDVVPLQGLSLADLTTLLNAHRDAVAAFVGSIQDAKGAQKLTLDNSRMIGEALLAAAPNIAADIIAMGARQPDAGPQIAKMPFPMQLEAFEEISNLTFKAVSQKKVLELLTRLLGIGTTLANAGRQQILQGIKTP